MLEINVNIEEMFKHKVFMCGDYAFTNYAIQEWSLYGTNISGMIAKRIAATRNRPETEIADESLNLILDQMKQKFSNMMKTQEYFYHSPVLQTTPILHTPVALVTSNSEPQVNLAQRYVEEIQKTLMNVSSKYSTSLCKIAICEMIWEINTILSYLKNNQYPRFYFQIWYDTAEHTIRVELHDPFDMIPEDKKIFGIVVQPKDPTTSVEQSKSQEPPKEEDPFEDVPKDEDVSNNGIRTRRPRATVHKRNIQIMSLMKAIHRIDNHAPSNTLLRGFFDLEDLSGHKLTNTFNKLRARDYIKKVDDNHSWSTYHLTDKGEAAVTNTHASLSWTAWFKNIFQNEDVRTMAISFFLNGANRQSLTTTNRTAYMALLMSGLMVLVGDRLTRTEFGEKVYKLFNQEQEEGIHNAN